MRSPLYTPLEQLLTNAWNGIDLAYRKAFLFILAINLLAFGFEMTNLTLHHDDIAHIFIQDTILGHYLGRFGFGWLHYYTQNAYIMPFLQMAEAIVLMSGYGLLIARLWGAHKTLDIVLISSVMCVFPYMAQIYQYNACTAPFALAHFLAAAAVFLSVRGKILGAVAAALLYAAAFSIYQSVLANAATIFCIWVLSHLLFARPEEHFAWRSMAKTSIGALLAVGVGGLIYMAVVSTMDLKFDSYQAAGQAFNLSEGLNLPHAATEILKESRGFFFWPENYFPGYLKNIQLLLLAVAALFCLWLPRSLAAKVGALTLLILAMFSPRLLQFLHPAGHYHALTLTAYAVLIAGCVMVINRAGQTLTRNLSIVVTAILIAGFILQSNWISTVNYLNTLSHYTTLTQILAHARSLPATDWDGKKIVVVGSYNMRSEYPFKGATGVASEYMDVVHMQHLARLMRDDVVFLQADDKTPGALQYAATHQPWPNPSSIGVVDGIGVIVLSNGSKQPIPSK
jgi:hypothetical protein